MPRYLSFLALDPDENGTQSGNGSPPADTAANDPGTANATDAQGDEAEYDAAVFGSQRPPPKTPQGTPPAGAKPPSAKAQPPPQVADLTDEDREIVKALKAKGLSTAEAVAEVLKGDVFGVYEQGYESAKSAFDEERADLQRQIDQLRTPQHAQTEERIRRLESENARYRDTLRQARQNPEWVPDSPFEDLPKETWERSNQLVGAVLEHNPHVQEAISQQMFGLSKDEVRQSFNEMRALVDGLRKQTADREGQQVQDTVTRLVDDATKGYPEEVRADIADIIADATFNMWAKVRAAERNYRADPQRFKPPPKLNEQSIRAFVKSRIDTLLNFSKSQRAAEMKKFQDARRRAGGAVTPPAVNGNGRQHNGQITPEDERAYDREIFGR